MICRGRRGFILFGIAFSLGGQTAQAGERHRLSIPAQPMTAAVLQLGVQARVSINAGAAACGRSRAVRGSHDVQSALRLMTEGSACAFRRIDDRTYIITPRPQPRPASSPRTAPEAPPVEHVPFAVDDVIVTATKRDLALADAPYALSALDGDVFDAAARQDTAALATRLTKTAPPWLARMILLAVNTGLRRGDLLKLCWSHIGSDEIEIRTGKSRDKIKALIPLHADLETVLASIPKRGPLVLTYDDSRRPVTANGFTSAWRRAWADAGMGDADLHFNDLRGTAITRLYLAEFSEREIAEIVGWTEESVKRIIHRYVGRAAAVRNRIERINQIKKGTDFAK